jgi:hypothetical protein
MVLSDNTGHEVMIPSFYKREDILKINQPQLFSD